MDRRGEAALWVTDLPDPGGYRLSFESLTEVPEETVFSEQNGGGLTSPILGKLNRILSSPDI